MWKGMGEGGVLLTPIRIGIIKLNQSNLTFESFIISNILRIQYT